MGGMSTICEIVFNCIMLLCLMDVLIFLLFLFFPLFSSFCLFNFEGRKIPPPPSPSWFAPEIKQGHKIICDEQGVQKKVNALHHVQCTYTEFIITSVILVKYI